MPGLILGALLTARDLAERSERLAGARSRALRRVAGGVLLILVLGFELRSIAQRAALQIGISQSARRAACRWADAALPAQALVIRACSLKIAATVKVSFTLSRHWFRRYEDIVTSVNRYSFRRVQSDKGASLSLTSYCAGGGDLRQAGSLSNPFRGDPMVKKALALSWLVSLLCYAGCLAGEKEVRPAATATPTPEVISYGRGFFDLERGPDGSTWRWMGEEGVIKLKNTGREMRLGVTGAAPVDRFPQPPTITLQFNGEQLDQFAAVPGVMEKEYPIPASRQGSGEWSELRLSTNKSFIPKEVDKGSTDPRRLGFSLHRLTWEAR
jgi:hypothetical protein